MRVCVHGAIHPSPSSGLSLDSNECLISLVSLGPGTGLGLGNTEGIRPCSERDVRPSKDPWHPQCGGLGAAGAHLALGSFAAALLQDDLGRWQHCLLSLWLAEREAAEAGCHPVLFHSLAVRVLSC